jgi:OmpA-OmpF porin, OOP family
MKRNVWLGWVATLGLTMLGATASAADTDPGFYIGAGIGEATVEIDDLGFDESDTAFKLFGGYRFNPYFGIELAYFDGGTAAETSADFLVPIEIESTGVNLSGIVTAPFGENFTLFGKLGYASIDFEGAANVLGQQISLGDETEEELSFGAGAAYAINENFSLRAEYEAFDLDDTDASVATVSAIFRF